MLLFGLLACISDTSDTADPNLGPEMSHSLPEGDFLEGDEIAVEVSASDEDGIAGVSVVFRTIDGAFSSSVELQASEEGETWSGVIPGEDVKAPGVSYYFKATDLAEPEAVSYLPEDISDAYELPVEVVGRSLPFVEGFELAEGQVRLESLGWANASLAFPGYHWNLNEVEPFEGVLAAIHQRGHETVDEMDDWLISPALDITDVERVQVSWYERGYSVEAADHSLWVSTGSRDPSSGDWIEVAIVDPPGQGEWSRTAVIELFDVSGTAVYLAWRYRGAYADEWRLDQVEVKELTADLQLEALAWTPDPVQPGETTTLTVDLVNAIDAEALGASITASLPAGGGEFTTDTADLGDIGSDASVSADFEITIDSDWPDNSYLPLSFDVTDSVGDSWHFDTVMVVGYPAEGRIELTLVEDALVSIDIGVGDPDAPVWQEALFADSVTAGLLAISWDLTERYESLPPGPADGRWFAKVTTGGQALITLFEIDSGDLTYEATDLPVVLPDETVVVYVPQPPDPVVVNSGQTPSQPAPGGLVSLSPTLTNKGAATAGATTLSLTSEDPDVTVTEGGPVGLTSSPWQRNSQATVAKALTFQVAAEHIDSTPVDLVLVIDDGVESFQVPMEVEVPWPVLKITAVDIDDGDGGDDDGLLEPGESAEIEFEITNVGGLATFGFVYGGPSVDSSSTADASFVQVDENWGSIGINVTKDESFDITVDADSSIGDTLNITLALRDDDTTYDVPLQIILGEPPWLSVSAIDDNRADAYGYDFDIVNAQYRCDGVTFELILESAEPYPSNAFVEMFALPTAAGYDLYRVVYNAGSAKLQAYEFNTGQSFFTIDTPTVEHVDSTHLKLSWSVETMDLSTDSLSVAFGAGWCGSDTGSFCDHFANGWGYYYTGYYSSRFFNISW